MRFVPALILAFAPLLGHAQQAPGYKDVALEAIFSEWDEITKAYAPGMSVMRPQKLRFTAKHLTGPKPCNTAPLEMIVKVDSPIEIYADLLAYGVGTDRARNMPFMLVNRFEPK
jgi:hypothetical protein